jgi:hypothetical protein
MRKVPMPMRPDGINFPVFIHHYRIQTGLELAKCHATWPDRQPSGFWNSITINEIKNGRQTQKKNKKCCPQTWNVNNHRHSNTTCSSAT